MLQHVTVRCLHAFLYHRLQHSYQNVFPVLHQEDVGLVQHQHLNGREEVKVSLALSFGS